MRRRLVIALLMVAPQVALAQDNSASLTGRIEDGSGVGFGGGIVNLDSERVAVHKQAQTDAGGVFRFSGLPAGTYLLQVPSGFDFKATLSLGEGEQKSLPALRLTLGVSGGCGPDPQDPERTDFLRDGSKGAVAGHVEKASAPIVDVWVTVQPMFGPGAGGAACKLTPPAGLLKLETNSAR
jgi:hypothetical protein